MSFYGRSTDQRFAGCQRYCRVVQRFPVPGGQHEPRHDAPIVEPGDEDGHRYLVTLKSDEDETAISFQFKDYPARHLLYGERQGQSGRFPHGLFRGNGRYRPNALLWHSFEQYSSTTLYDPRPSG